jgi:hypothetical protein
MLPIVIFFSVFYLQVTFLPRPNLLVQHLQQASLRNNAMVTAIKQVEKLRKILLFLHTMVLCGVVIAVSPANRLLSRAFAALQVSTIGRVLAATASCC